MNILTATNDVLQTQTIILDDGSSFVFTLQYKPAQLGWFIVNLTYGTFVLNSIRVCASPNILYQFKNQIPFGLACEVVGNREPMLAEDFLAGNAVLYLLSKAECVTLSEIYSGQVSA